MVACTHAAPGPAPPQLASGHPAREPCLIEHTTSSDPAIGRTCNRFDGAGRLIASERDDDGDGTIDQVVRRSYDGAGRLLAVDEGDRVLRYQLDGTGRVVARVTERPGRPELRTELRYDGAGRLVAELDRVTELRYQYDGAGHLVREQRFEPGERAPRADRTSRYDDAGRLVGRDGFDETGTLHETWGYDHAGREVARELTRDGALALATRVSYDRAGHRTGEEYRDAAAKVTGRRTWTYDAAGDLVTDEIVDLVDATWTRDRFTYGAAGAAGCAGPAPDR